MPAEGAVSDGGRYWDGGYMGNPALFPLVGTRHSEPVEEITFNTSLLKELRSLAFLWEIIHYENLERERFRDVHVHAIHDAKTMLELGVSSKVNAEWAFLTHLRDCGRRATQDWLSQHYEDIGVRNTLDLSWIYDESLCKPACCRVPVRRRDLSVRHADSGRAARRPFRESSGTNISISIARVLSRAPSQRPVAYDAGHAISTDRPERLPK
jgi:hypothetical protein